MQKTLQFKIWKEAGVKIWYYNSINWSDKVSVKTLTENNETIENFKNVQHDTIVDIRNGKRKDIMFHLMQ